MIIISYIKLTNWCLQMSLISFHTCGFYLTLDTSDLTKNVSCLVLRNNSHIDRDTQSLGYN